MTNRDKMYHHLAEAERWHRRVAGYEEAAARETDDAYAQSKILDRFDYRSATANRNGHQQRAIMYGIAALVDRDTT